MRILIVGGGGREHALAWKLAQSTKVSKIYVCPGNPGFKGLAECIELPLDNYEKMADFVEQEKIELTVVGPEVYLVNGLVDVFAKRNLKVFGPSALAAEIEGSKAFSKNLMAKYKIPTAFFAIFENLEAAQEYIKEKGTPLVIKADGLAAGKGVVVAQTEQEALAAVEDMMRNLKFGGAGARVVIEEFMEGEEASVLAFTDGETIVPMVAAQDHKRVYDKDQGPNTGGMGAYAPAPVMTNELTKKCIDLVLKPVLAAMKAEGRVYKGCLYAGLMIKDNEIKVVEFNARFGDPETQVVLPLLKTDLAEIMLACVNGTLADMKIEWEAKAAVCVVAASGGYPAKYEQGHQINGLEVAQAMPETIVFHAGTKFAQDAVVNSGGRVLGVTATGENIAEARNNAYAALKKIQFKDMHYRSDIAWRALR
ncbi:MAG TPA: phosphoribosylamine--glycine ligase [Candidatus Avacidaminococcus intestinavium]|uniref:Phosphoribosylamine--glycine ligase n=1 Tax=Candidatus Avacidaminococcus intestinavium TaxID=2840684 RepID=A0A9D1MNN7_9FIRM|nr:phosphoribosylamine--glycine ligase [Candidatus Avacidaminococcus intestinavium]